MAIIHNNSYPSEAILEVECLSQYSCSQRHPSFLYLKYIQKIWIVVVEKTCFFYLRLTDPRLSIAIFPWRSRIHGDLTTDTTDPWVLLSFLNQKKKDPWGPNFSQDCEKMPCFSWFPSINWKKNFNKKLFIKKIVKIKKKSNSEILVIPFEGKKKRTGCW